MSISSKVLPTGPRCGNLLPSEQMYHEGLPHSQRWDGVGVDWIRMEIETGKGWDGMRGNGIGVKRRWRWGWGRMGRGSRLRIRMGMGMRTGMGV